MRQQPTAITCNGAKYPEESRSSALQWAARQVKKLGGKPLVYVPSKGVLSEYDALSDAIRRYSFSTQTFKQYAPTGWPGGPVIALAPDAKHLFKIDSEPQSTALCVIPWLEEDTRAWELLHDPERLEGADDKPDPIRLDRITASAMRSLTITVNMNNDLAGAFDHDEAVNTLNVLHDNGYPIPGPDLYVWALSHGWGEPGAARLKEMAEKLNTGHRLRLQTLSKLDSKIVDFWSEHADDAFEIPE